MNTQGILWNVPQQNIDFFKKDKKNFMFFSFKWKENKVGFIFLRNY